MPYGMNLLLWTGEFTDDMLPVCEQLKEIGFEGVEIPIFNLDLDYAAIGKQLESLGLRRTAATIRNAEDNPISPDAKVRAKGVELNKRALDCCAAAGVETLVGPLHSALGHFTGVGRTDDEWKWGVEAMRQTAEHAGSVGVQVGVEPLNRFECYFLNTHADTAKFIGEVDHPACKMMFDSFHGHIEENSITEAIEVGGDKLIHVHISENNRGTPGAGGLNWKEYFDVLVSTDFDGWIVIEAFGQSLPELAAATKIWRKMFDTEIKLAADGFKFMTSELQSRGYGK